MSDRPRRPRRDLATVALDRRLGELGREVEQAVLAAVTPASRVTVATRARALPAIDEALATVYPVRRGSSSVLEDFLVERTAAQWQTVLEREAERFERELGERLAWDVATRDPAVRRFLEMTRAGAARRREIALAYDDARTWVDPSGRRLSDRLWRVRQSVRAGIDAEIRTAILRGTDALQLAKQLNHYLTPVGAQPRTKAPGRGGQGSYAARRLARTEITRALGQATLTAAAANPMVDGIRWRLSASHPKQDVCDDHAGHDEGMGKGVWPKRRVPRFPPHPYCLCVLLQVTPSRDEALARIRAQYGLGGGLDRQTTGVQTAELDGMTVGRFPGRRRRDDGPRTVHLRSDRLDIAGAERAIADQDREWLYLFDPQGRQRSRSYGSGIQVSYPPAFAGTPGGTRDYRAVHNHPVTTLGGDRFPTPPSTSDVTSAIAFDLQEVTVVSPPYRYRVRRNRLSDGTESPTWTVTPADIEGYEEDALAESGFGPESPDFGSEGPERLARLADVQHRILSDLDAARWISYVREDYP